MAYGLGAVLQLLGCLGPREPTEFKVQLYCRGDTEQCTAPDCIQDDMPAALAANAAEGWRYLGPLSDNGMNCRFIAFGR